MLGKTNIKFKIMYVCVFIKEIIKKNGVISDILRHKAVSARYINRYLGRACARASGAARRADASSRPRSALGSTSPPPPCSCCPPPRGRRTLAAGRPAAARRTCTTLLLRALPLLLPHILYI